MTRNAIFGFVTLSILFVLAVIHGYIKSMEAEKQYQVALQCQEEAQAQAEMAMRAADEARMAQAEAEVQFALARDMREQLTKCQGN